MHDINPLGTTMHLRELDRRTAPTFRAVPSRKPAGSKAPSIRVGLGKVLTRLRAGYASLVVRAS
jgi:hypothetical protein